MRGRVRIQVYCLVLLIAASPTLSLGPICAQLVYGNFYDLGTLKSDDGYSLDISNVKGKILFNMCQFSTFRCPGYNDSIAVYKSEDMCAPLTTSSLNIGYNSSLLIDANQTNKTAGLNMSFLGAVSVDPGMGNSSQNYSLEMHLHCDPNATEYVWDDPLPAFNEINGTFIINGRGAASCAKLSGSFIVEFFNKFSYLTAIIAIAIGLFQCFYGYRLYRPTVFLLGFILAFLVLVLFLFEIWTGPDSPSYKGYVIVAFAIVAGILFGFLVASIAWVAVVVSGAVLGFFLSTFIYTLALYSIKSKPANLVFYNTLVIGMVLGCIAGYEFQSPILILSCAFSGAYLIVRGVSVFIGGFPAELDLASQTQSGIQDESTAWYYIYLASILILTAAGVFVQRRLYFSDSLSEKGNALLRKLLHRGEEEQVEILEAAKEVELKAPLIVEEVLQPETQKESSPAKVAIPDAFKKKTTVVDNDSESEDVVETKKVPDTKIPAFKALKTSQISPPKQPKNTVVPPLDSSDDDSLQNPVIKLPTPPQETKKTPIIKQKPVPVAADFDSEDELSHESEEKTPPPKKEIPKKKDQTATKVVKQAQVAPPVKPPVVDYDSEDSEHSEERPVAPPKKPEPSKKAAPKTPIKKKTPPPEPEIIEGDEEQMQEVPKPKRKIKKTPNESRLTDTSEMLPTAEKKKKLKKKVVHVEPEPEVEDEPEHNPHVDSDEHPEEPEPVKAPKAKKKRPKKRHEEEN